MLTIAPARRRRALLVLIAAAGTVLPAGAADAATLPAGSTAVLSGDDTLFAPLPTPVSASWAGNESVSADGRYVVFSSTANGLSDEDDDRVSNIFVKDRDTGAVELVSRATGTSGAPADHNCDHAVISDDGTTVAFTCQGPLEQADDNKKTDVYVRRLDDDTTELASRATGNGAVGDNPSDDPTISANGREVAFASNASNLESAALTKVHRVYRRSLTGTRATVLVSRKSATDGNAPMQGSQPSIDDSGNHVAFSAPESLTTADNNTFLDVYVRDVTAGTSELQSRAEGNNGTVGNQPSTQPAISGDAKSIAFQSHATNFQPGSDSDVHSDIYVRVRAGVRPTFLASVNDLQQKAMSAVEPSISRDGSAVGFLARGELHPADTNSTPDAYVKHVALGDVDLVSRADGGYEPITGIDVGPVALNGDGTKAVFSIDHGGKLGEIDPRFASVQLRDLAANPRRTYPVSRPAGSEPFDNAGGQSGSAVLSADGRYAAFVTRARGLGVPEAVTTAVVVRDRVTGTVTLASRKDGLDGSPFGGDIGDFAISADGRRVAFSTEYPDGGLWVRDLATGRTSLASRANGANGAPADKPSWQAALDADGSRVAFLTEASLSSDDQDLNIDAYVRDLDTDETILATRASGGAGAKGNGTTASLDLNGDGSRLVFNSTSTNFGNGDSTTDLDVHLRDLTANTTTLISANPGGAKAEAPSFNPTIDASGRRIAFTTAASNLPDGTAPGNQLYVRDLAADSLTLASRADGAAGAPGDANHAVISPDGGSVAFDGATPLADGVTGSASQVYVRNLAAGSTTLVSRGAEGRPGTEDSYGTDISGGGGCVAFEGRDLIGAKSDASQVYLRAIEKNCGDPDPAPVPAPGGGDGGGGQPSGSGEPGGQGGGKPEARDTTAPRLSGAKLNRKKFRAGRGAVLTFRSTEAATVTVQFERALPGKRVGARCRPVKKRPKKGACTAYKRAGTITRTVRAGNARIALTGRIGRKAMAPGAYRLTLAATDAAGNRSAPVSLRFSLSK